MGDLIDISVLECASYKGGPLTAETFGAQFEEAVDEPVGLRDESDQGNELVEVRLREIDLVHGAEPLNARQHEAEQLVLAWSCLARHVR
ncbi:hypothetical protein [Demequina sp.]|uniref:hypothetical protein n=1 Tax=Demequina sp. TaxID=2050685 RepID=UPI003D113CD1